MVYVKIIQSAVDIIDTCKPVPINFLLTNAFMAPQDSLSAVLWILSQDVSDRNRA